MVGNGISEPSTVSQFHIFPYGFLIASLHGTSGLAISDTSASVSAVTFVDDVSWRFESNKFFKRFCTRKTKIVLAAKWKITMCNRRYIFKLLFFLCHVWGCIVENVMRHLATEDFLPQPRIALPRKKERIDLDVFVWKDTPPGN